MERKCLDDRKVWARHLEALKKEASLAELIAWMNTEMKSRVRATAALTNTNQSLTPSVNQLSSQDDNLRTQAHHPPNAGCVRIQVTGLIMQFP